MKKNIAKAISLIFNPLIMPSLGILMIFSSGSLFNLLPPELKKIIFYSSLTITFAIPLSVIIFFNINGKIDYIYLNDIEKRRMPFFITFVFYGFSAFLFMKFKIIPRFIQLYMFAVALSVFLSLIITFRWKISIHMVGIGGITGLAISLLPYHPFYLDIWIISLVFISGLIGYSRLKLDIHEPLQIYSGFLLGFITVAAILFFI
jgi:membrane-associated phospholipid phosphatase